MKIRQDYITNSSSSNYIIALSDNKDFNKFLQEDIENLIKKETMSDYDIDKLKSLLSYDVRQIKSKYRTFIILYHFLTDGHSFKNWKDREQVKEKIRTEIYSLPDDTKFYLTTDYEDDRSGNIFPNIEGRLDENTIFDYDKLKNRDDIKVFYINGH